MLPDIPPWLVSEVYEWLRDPSLAAVIATLSLIVSVKALRATRRSAPDVYGDFEVFEKSDDAPADMAPIAICITARNRGLASVNIEDFEMVNGDGRGNFRWRFRVADTCELTEGPPLPTPVKNGTKLTWWYDVRELKLSGLRDEVITEPLEIYKALSLPYLQVDFEDGSKATFRNADGRYAAWLYETIQDWRANRGRQAIGTTDDDVSKTAGGTEVPPNP